MDIPIYGGADIAAATIQIDWLESSGQQGHQLSIREHKRDYGRLVK
ncbi:MAG: hypothetical protein ABI690_00760 [Chloroflexota bacterium]